jgi:hypothetical protein
LIFGFHISIAPSYILNQIELGAKGYGLKHSIANFMNQPSCTLDATIVLEHTSQGKAVLLFGVGTKLETLFLAHLTH